MKKRLVMGIMSAALMAGMVLPVHAENTTGGNMDVNYTEANVYVISIPSSVTLQQGKETAAQQIAGTDINIAPDKEVQVKVTGGIENGAVTLALENGGAADKVTSTVSLTSAGTGIDSSTVVAKFSGQTTTPVSGGTLYFSGLQKDMKAGTWKGQLTFTVSLADVTP